MQAGCGDAGSGKSGANPEQLFALVGKEAFVRRITLESANLAGKDQATIRLALPDHNGVMQNGVFGRQSGPLFMALGVAGDHAKHTTTAGGNVFDIGPIDLTAVTANAGCRAATR